MPFPAWVAMNPQVVVSAFSELGDSFDVLPTEFGATAERAFYADGRAAGWERLARETVRAHPFCDCCGTTLDLQVHHVVPVSVDRSLELDPSNLMVLCRAHHFTFGHLCCWKSFSVTVRDDVAVWAEKIKRRPVPPAV